MTIEELYSAIKRGDAQPVDMWTLLKPRLYKLARKYPAESEDLVQQSYFGIVKALELHDPERGPFLPYCDFWIKKAMREAVDCACYLPVNVEMRARKYKRMLSTFAQMFGRDPTEAELVEAFGVGKDQLMREVNALAAVSLDAPLSDDITVVDTLQGLDGIEDAIIDKINEEDLRRALWGAVDDLPEKEAQAIRLRYQDNQTYKECGVVMGVSLERARAIEAQAIRRLKSKRQEFEAYVDTVRYSLGVRHSVMIDGVKYSSTEYAAIKSLEKLNLWNKEGSLII